jgi:hypothetical protein
VVGRWQHERLAEQAFQVLDGRPLLHHETRHVRLLVLGHRHVLAGDDAPRHDVHRLAESEVEGAVVEPAAKQRTVDIRSTTTGLPLTRDSTLAREAYCLRNSSAVLLSVAPSLMPSTSGSVDPGGGVGPGVVKTIGHGRRGAASGTGPHATVASSTFPQHPFVSSTIRGGRRSRSDDFRVTAAGRSAGQPRRVVHRPLRGQALRKSTRSAFSSSVSGNAA